MKLSDYVAAFLAEQGVAHVFGLTGGAVVHLFDSVARHGGLQPVFTHHEQAAALAAQAYARVHPSGLGACFVTTGPGGTNAVTGVTAAWLDSIPCVYISGQVRLAHTGRGSGVRQVGTQHLDILSIIRTITKHSVMIEDPKAIKYELQKAVWIARSGRPGPVWLDLPLDMQWSMINPDELPSFTPEPAPPPDPDLPAKIDACWELLSRARRPLIIAGYGVRLAGAEEELRRLLAALGTPFLTTWNVADILPSDAESNVGRPGIFGQRGANLAIQNCDLLLSIGSHLCVSVTGTMFNAFAREAKIVVVNVDPIQLAHRTVRVDLPIACDAGEFLRALLPRATARLVAIDDWRERCVRYQGYNAVPAEHWRQPDLVHPYVFIEELSRQLAGSDLVVVDGGGTINQITFQAFRVKAGQRLLISAGLCSMGSGLPESVGACLAGAGRRTICLCGDGSLQLNVQELQTIVHHRLPVKIFVLCNGGYVSIRQTQDGFLEGRHIGTDAAGGLSLPDFTKVGQAYGLPTYKIGLHSELPQVLAAILATPGPTLCEIAVSPDARPVPRQGFDRRPDGTHVPRPLEDMYPFLDREEFRAAMVVAPWTPKT